MNNIVLCRIDSRLIHGQVMTQWVQQSQANKIVIISDAVAKDLFLLEIYKMSAPPGIVIECYGIEDAVEKWQNHEFETGKILLLLPDIKTLSELAAKGVLVNKVQIGGLGGGPSRKDVYQNITLDDADANALQALSSQGVDIIFQTIPEDNPLKFEDALNRFKR